MGASLYAAFVVLFKAMWPFLLVFGLIRWIKTVLSVRNRLK